MPQVRLRRGVVIPFAEQIQRDEPGCRQRLKELVTENGRLKKLRAEDVLETEVIKDVLRKKWRARRLVVSRCAT